MKIKSVSKPIKIRIIETDAEDFPTYRRSSPIGWERLYGDSWEEYSMCDEIEAEYQRFMANKGMKPDQDRAA
jgi:hypothetical protein